MRIFVQRQLPSWQPYVFFDKEFTPSECDAIVSLGKTLRPVPALTGASTDANVEIRSAELHWLEEAETSRWIFDRLEGVCKKVNDSWYPFHLSGFSEPIQLTHYFADKGGHYDWHQDFGGESMSSRKLSLIALLSDPSTFTGGELEVLGKIGPDKVVRELTQGSVIAFPAWEFHRVAKLAEGERWSLVSWVHGHPFV